MISIKSLKKKLNQGLLNNLLLGGISIFLLFSGFYYNSFNTIKSESDWDHFRKVTEFMVIAKLAVSEEEGVFYKGGLTGVINEVPKKADAFDYTYQVYEEHIVIDKEQFSTYNSLIGGQAITFALLGKILPLSNSNKLRFFWVITVLGLSIVLTALLLWIKNKFGIVPAFLTLLMLMSSYWLTLFGKNLWWSLWNFYLPLVALLFFFDRNDSSEGELKKLFLISFVALFIKCFFSGYEYITTSVIMAACALIFYTVRNNWSLGEFVKKGLVFTAGTLAAVLLSFIILVLQITSITGSLSDGVNHIIHSFQKRTSGDGAGIDPIYTESLEASMPEVLQTYWNGVAFDFTSFFSPFWDSFMLVDFGELILLFAFFSALLMWQKNKPSTSSLIQSNVKALIMTTWFSLLAPLSWFTLFKGHSFIHTHMNFIVWYMPFVILGFAVVSVSLSVILRELNTQFRQSSLKIKLAYLSIPILISFALLISYSLKGIDNDEKINTLMKSSPTQTSENFKLYLQDNKLWYINEQPDRYSRDLRFLLHITPTNMADLSEERRIHGFDNLDFNDSKNDIDLPWWSKKRNYQIIVKELPTYSTKVIRTGQFNEKFEVVWDATIFLEK